MTKKHASEPLPKIFDRPALVFVITVIAIFLAESVVMLVLVFLPPLTTLKEALLDSLILILMLLPLLIFIIYKPLQIYITELKKANDVLLKSEKRFQDIADNALEWIWEVNSEGKYTYASAAVEKILGFKPEEILEKHFYDLFHPEERKELKSAAFEAFNRKQPFREFVNRNIHKKGNIVWLSTSGIPILDSGGRLLGYRGADTDISERKLAEEKLMESEIRFEDVTSNTGDWIWETDDQGKYTYSSPVVEKVIGYRPEEVVGKFFYDFIHSEERDEIKKSVYEVFSQKKNFINVLNNKVHKNGTTVVCESSGVPVIHKNGELRGYRGAVRDISQRKKAEDALRDSREMAKAISDTSMDAIIMMDGKGFISYFNSAAEKIFGYRQEEAVGRKLHSLLVSEKSREKYYERLPTFEKTGQCEIVGKTLELYGNKKDGSRFPLEISVSSFQIKGEWHAVGMVRDITARRDMEIQLKEAALTDELTGLLNRRGFHALSEQQCKISNRSKSGIALLYADLDNLKRINDELGHKAGDRALVDIARILIKTFRESDIVGRLGGDEFAVLLTGTSKPDIVETIISNVQDNLTIHNKGSNREYELSLSMGVAYCDPETSCTLDELLTEADKIMYQKKSLKKNVS